jgi:putative Holliday junction resolvase
MRILGIDYGDSKIGLAVSDPLQLTAQILDNYRIRGKNEDKEYFKKIVSEYEIEEIVLGLPLRMDGTSGPRVEKTKSFAQWLKKFLKVPIIYWDERLTTRQAIGILSRQKIKRKSKKVLEDQIAAVIILSSYLESKRGRLLE